MTPVDDLEAVRDEVMHIVVEEAKSIRRYTSTDRRPADSVTTKSSIGDIVTSLDRELEAVIGSELSSLIPGSQILGEEEGLKGHGPVTWVVDPIDGSTNVIHGMPHAAVSVALCVDRAPKIGVVHDPFAGKTYHAVLERGAFMRPNGTRGDGAEARSDERLHVSSIRQLTQALVGFGLPYDRAKTQQIFRQAERVFSRCQDLRRRGCASLDIVSVALGELDGYFELDLRAWDVLAAELILREAGGRLTGWTGEEILWDSADDKLSILASNGLIHRELQGIVSDPS